MGLFDQVVIKYGVPWPEMHDTIWQSKDTPAQYLDRYELRRDGTLWHVAHDTPLDNKRWEPVSFTGELECHQYIEHDDRPGGMWYSVQFWLRAGVVKDVVYSKRDTRKPAPAPAPE